MTCGLVHTYAHQWYLCLFSKWHNSDVNHTFHQATQVGMATARTYLYVGVSVYNWRHGAIIHEACIIRERCVAVRYNKPVQAKQ